MKCNTCGAEIPEGNNFCGKCGATAPQSVVQQVGQADPMTSFPPPEKVTKKATVDYIAVVIGVVLFIAGTIARSSVAIIGLIFFAVGSCTPPRTNFCPNCGMFKDLSAKTCPRCGRQFTASVENIITGIVIIAVGSFVVLMIKNR